MYTEVRSMKNYIEKLSVSVGKRQFFFKLPTCTVFL